MHPSEPLVPEHSSSSLKLLLKSRKDINHEGIDEILAELMKA
jgi:hypothetical protein